MKRPAIATMICACFWLAGCAKPAPVCDALIRPPTANDPARLVAEERAVAEHLKTGELIGREHGCWER